jgi:hypothetical protein
MQRRISRMTGDMGGNALNRRTGCGKRKKQNASARAWCGNILKKQHISGFLKKVRSLHAAASLTVEAAWVVPLFFLCVVSLILMMDFYGAYSDRQMALCQEAEREAAVPDPEAGERYVDLVRPVVCQARWFPVPLPGRSVLCRGRVRVWSGEEGYAQAAENGGGTGSFVLVTEHGSVYHTSAECTHIALSFAAVSREALGTLRNEEGHRYHACGKCVHDGRANGTVYVAREGVKYHNDASCSGLIRKVRLIPETEAAGLPQCSRCAHMEGKTE